LRRRGLKYLGMTLQSYGLVARNSRIVKRRVCYYDVWQSRTICFVLKDTVGEMYFCNLRCFCVWSVLLATRPNHCRECIFDIPALPEDVSCDVAIGNLRKKNVKNKQLSLENERRPEAAKGQTGLGGMTTVAIAV